MPVYSKRLAMGTQAAGTSSTVYTAPVGTTTVVRDICAYPDAAPANELAIDIGVVAPIFVVSSAPANNTVHWEGRVVLNPGDTLEVSAVTAAWQYIITGYELI